jgi:hypothetical protein
MVFQNSLEDKDNERLRALTKNVSQLFFLFVNTARDYSQYKFIYNNELESINKI